jgi:aspartyl/glutamyl-tRNA(Asn/Gln) amidotransferase C subunit
MTPTEIQKLASLAAISISEEQTQTFAQEFAEILEYVQKIQTQENDEIEAPQYHVETLRADSPESPFDEHVADRVLEAAPRTHQRYFRVQAVLKK